MSHIKCQLNHFFKWLVDQGAYEVNPLSCIKFKQGLPSAKERVVFNKDQLYKILEASKIVSLKCFYPFLYTLISTGARRSEVLGLRWCDVSFSRNELVFRKTKNGTDRKIKMGSNLSSLLLNKKKTLSLVASEVVFLNDRDLPLSRQVVQRFFRELRELLPDYGLGWACHSMRHSFAYNYLKSGREMYQLKAILGHKSIKMTVDLYGNLKSEDIDNPSPYDF